jgi:Big-like domain-containing protein/subtilase family protein
VSPEIAHAINVATSSGVICVASAGNAGQEVLVYPGSLRNVLGVGSTTTGNPPARSWFSNFGDASVSLGAPGEGVITTYPGGGYAAASGTSFSAPLTSGAAALLVQIDPTMNQAKADSLLGNADRMEGGMGKGRLNLDVAVRTLPDAAPPAVTMTSPVGGVLFGSVLVSASAVDNVGVAGVQFLLDASPLGAELSGAPFELTWATTTASNGTHVLTAVARDAAGNQVTAASVSVTVANDTTAPTVQLTSPAVGATVGGTVTVAAAASDDVGIVGVQFMLDDTAVLDDTTAPYELVWNTTAHANGAHTLTAIARDAAGNQTTATTVSVTVQNDVAAPTVAMTAPAAAGSVAGTVTVAATASDDVGVAGVQFTLDGAPLGAENTTSPYALAWNTTTVANGAHTVTAIARDAAGHQTTATSVSITVANDITPPTVTVMVLTPTFTLAGVVTVMATATDNVGVAGVRFTLDGAALGAEVTTAPYELAWDTKTVANGLHTVRAIARDAAGHEATASAAATVIN